MVQNLESSNTITPQEMHQRVLMQRLFSYDKDGKEGLSKAELNDYLFESNLNKNEIPDFANKLAEKFNELDQNKDGQLSSAETNSLHEYRGLWQITPLGVAQNNTFPGQNNQSIVSPTATDVLSKNIQSLVKKGLGYVKNNPDLMSKLEQTVHKII